MEVKKEGKGYDEAVIILVCVTIMVIACIYNYVQAHSKCLYGGKETHCAV